MTELAGLDASRNRRTRWMSREATVEKAIETDVIRALTRRARKSGAMTRYVPLQAVAYFAALKQAKLVDLPVRLKKALWREFTRLETTKLVPIEFSPGNCFPPGRISQELF